MLSDTESVTESTLIDNIENKIKEVSLSTDKNDKKGGDESQQEQSANITYDDNEIAKADDYTQSYNVYVKVVRKYTHNGFHNKRRRN